MAVGRKAQPAALQLVKGRGDGKDSGGRPVKHPPKFKREAPVKPDDMSDVASALWDELVNELEDLDLLKLADGSALRIACETFHRWVEARQLRMEQGLTTVTGDGSLKKAPWVSVEEAASKEFRAWCSEFGLTPSAEMRLAKDSGDGDAGDNPFAGD